MMFNLSHNTVRSKRPYARKLIEKYQQVALANGYTVENSAGALRELQSKRESILRKASLILLPLAYKPGYLLALDGDGNGVDVPFSRPGNRTRVNAQGIIEELGDHVPGIDYSDGEGKWLLEPGRTNNCSFSNGLNLPAGIPNVELIETTNNLFGDQVDGHFIRTIDAGNSIALSYHRIISTSYSLNNEPLVFSFFIKKGTADFFTLSSSIIGWRISVDLNSGDTSHVGFTNSEAIQIAPGIYRVSGYGGNFTYTGGSEIRGGAVGHLGSTMSVADKSYWIGGWHLELNASYPSSHINTSGSAVSRSVEQCAITGISSLIGQGYGVLYNKVVCQYDFTHEIANNGFIAGPHLKPVSTNYIGVQGGIKHDGTVVTHTGGWTLGLHKADVPSSLGVFQRIATRYQTGGAIGGEIVTNGSSNFVNGVKISDGNCSGFDDLSVFFLHGTLNVNTADRGKTVNLGVACSIIFPEALSDAECQEFTAL